MHCTSGSPASIMTENCRVKTARVLEGTLRPIFVSEISLPRSRIPVTTMFWRRRVARATSFVSAASTPSCTRPVRFLPFQT